MLHSGNPSLFFYIIEIFLRLRKGVCLSGHFDIPFSRMERENTPAPI